MINHTFISLFPLSDVHGNVFYDLDQDAVDTMKGKPIYDEEDNVLGKIVDAKIIPNTRLLLITYEEKTS